MKAGGQRSADRARPTEGATRIAIAAGMVGVLLGLWLILAPYALDYADAGRLAGYWNDIAVGAAIVVLSLFRAALPAQLVSLSWVNGVLGGWLISAPLVLGYGPAGYGRGVASNDVAVGTAMVGLAGVSAAAGRRLHRAEAGQADTCGSPGTVQ